MWQILVFGHIKSQDRKGRKTGIGSYGQNHRRRKLQQIKSDPMTIKDYGTNLRKHGSMGIWHDTEVVAKERNPTKECRQNQTHNC